jgi:hypothetical protein
MARVTIRKGNMALVDMDRSDLIDVNPSHDGVVFTFKNNAYLYFTDQNLPTAVKEVMKNTANNFPLATLDFDVGNYKKPVTAEIK